MSYIEPIRIRTKENLDAASENLRNALSYAIQVQYGDAAISQAAYADWQRADAAFEKAHAAYIAARR